jgi:anaerobic ribonucleoside-triphosphate reductase activating protein
MTVEQVVEQLLVSPTISGLTFSGGEPMFQAALLARVVKLARKSRSLDLICFSGYKYETLLNDPPNSGVPHLLNEVDVLIDGNYIQKLNSGRGLRGSDNQRILHLTDRLKGFDLENSPRRMEISLHSGELAFTGIPPLSVTVVIDQTIPS